LQDEVTAAMREDTTDDKKAYSKALSSEKSMAEALAEKKDFQTASYLAYCSVTRWKQ
jgi:hypothetical protein